MLAVAAFAGAIANHGYIALIVINTLGVIGGVIYGAMAQNLRLCVAWSVIAGIIHLLSWGLLISGAKARTAWGWGLGVVVLILEIGLATYIVGWWSL
jgi:hypothetical protein